MWTKYLKIPKFFSISREQVNSLLDRYVEKGLTVLDVGCGYGRISKYLHDNDRAVTAIDMEQEMVDTVSKMGIEALLMNAMDLKFDDNKFDVVLTDGLLEHFEDDEDIKKIIREEFRVAKRYIINIVPKDIFINAILEIIQRVPKEYRDKDWMALHKEIAKDNNVFVVEMDRINAYIIEKR